MKSVCFLFCFIIASLAHGQTETPQYHPIDQDKWEKTVKGHEYNEQSEKEEVKPEENKEPDNTDDNSFYLPEWLKYFGYVLIGALLVFILIKLFAGGLFTANTKVRKQEITIADLDERPMETELERFLREALAAGNYRLAIRIYYLMILKGLHEKKLITWKKNKTNFDYLHEMYGNQLFNDFDSNTRIFEYIWYGELNLGETQFKEVSPAFTGTIQKIGSEG